MEKCYNEENVQIVTNDGDSSEYHFEDENGESFLTVYRVFSGIDLIYYDVHTRNGKFDIFDNENMMEILHCREGRVEFEYGDNLYHLSAGDVAVFQSSECGKNFYYPLRHYHGIAVRVNLDRAPRCFSCMMEDVDVKPAAIAEKFCGEGSCFIARSGESIEHIFSELYRIPESIRRGYLKVKVLELFLFLSALPVGEDEHSVKSCSRQQAVLAKDICKYLTDHMDDRITLEFLAKEFHTSGTNIKNCFKAVYGVSVYSYIRTQKMESAAYMLEYTDKSILEIASEHGYDNGSKFASAFRAVKGMAPSEYRNQNYKIK